DGRVDAQADAGGLGNVFQQLHLPGGAVVGHAVDVVALPVLPEQAVLPDAGGDAVDQDVFAALRRVDEFVALVRVPVVRGEGGQVVRDGAGVAVVPVGDRGHGLVRVQVHGVGAAAELLRRQVDVAPERLAYPLEPGPETRLLGLLLRPGRVEAHGRQPLVQ